MHENKKYKRMKNDILEHKKAVVENIYKSFGENIDIQKAHYHGEIHKNGKWYWNSQAAGGKGDWRVIKKKPEKQTTDKEKTGRYKNAEEFIEALKPEDMSNIIYMNLNEKLKIFRSETNLENLEAGLKALKRGRDEYLKKVREGVEKRDNELMRRNRELVDKAQFYFDELRKKDIIARGATQKELDDFLRGLENKYAADLIDKDTFYKKLKPDEINYLLLKVTDYGKYKPFLTQKDFPTQKDFRKYHIKTDVIKNLLYRKTGEYPQWDSFESMLEDFYKENEKQITKK